MVNELGIDCIWCRGDKLQAGQASAMWLIPFEHITPAESTTLLPAIWCCCCRSVSQLCLTLCDPMDLSTPGFPVLHHLPELAQTHVHWVSDAIQPSRPVIPFSSCLQSFPAPGPFLMSQLFTSGGQSMRAIWCTNAFSGGRKYNVGWSCLWPSSLAAWKKIWEIDSSVWIYWYDF